jgi:drug/metabolite transporter (DMT)-like permease
LFLKPNPATLFNKIARFKKTARSTYPTMKAYLITTGIIFGLIAFAHAWRAIAERDLLRTNPGEFISMALLGILAASLCIWAFRLVGKSSRA